MDLDSSNRPQEKTITSRYGSFLRNIGMVFVRCNTHVPADAVASKFILFKKLHVEKVHSAIQRIVTTKHLQHYMSTKSIINRPIWVNSLFNIHI